MSFELILFYLFSAVLLTAAVTMVTVRNPVYAALCLILCFFTSAAMWIMLQAEFLGIVLVLVYVGAVMVLFLFVIMMLDVKREVLRESFGKYLPFGLGVAALVAAEMILVLRSANFADVAKYSPVDFDRQHSNTEALGELLYKGYLYPFEIAGVILLVAIIAAIVLTLRDRGDTKTQEPEQQIRTRREDRVRIVKMEVEK
ncbi:MAG: NADH-quinone oxidoreductase subunit J [Thiolinea sp.]